MINYKLDIFPNRNLYQYIQSSLNGEEVKVIFYKIIKSEENMITKFVI